MKIFISGIVLDAKLLADFIKFSAFVGLGALVVWA
jgi:hypothetical protein